jgi:hypothetical protein
VSLHEELICTAVVLVLLAGPAVLGLTGLMRARRERSAAAAPLAWNWKLTVTSALLYTLAFNVTFFLQELFLVLPKALTPGLRPTLFHNNHTWEGADPVARLYQGTGAVAILASGIVCGLLLWRATTRSKALRLFLLWMTYNGIFQCLSQVIIGSVLPGNDVGMAMDYLGLGVPVKTAAALAALALIPAVGLWLAPSLLSIAGAAAAVADAPARTRFVFQAATLPALIAIVLIIPFRVPRAWIEVVLVPAIVVLVGIPWLQAGAWCMSAAPAGDTRNGAPITYLWIAAVLLLLLFQLVLRPGIRFY